MSKKHLNRSAIPQYDPQKKRENVGYINSDAAFSLGWDENGDDKYVKVSIQLVQYDFECFSDWSKREMQSFWDLIKRIHSSTWQYIYSQSGKGKDKTGLGYTQIKNHRYPNKDFIESLSPDTNFFELRVTDKARLHCFRSRAVCYICWLDKDHKLT